MPSELEEERPDPSFFLHNLRNYIGTIIASADRLKNDKNDERALQLVKKAADLSLRDLQAFCDLTRPLDLKSSMLDLTGWLRDTVASHQAAKTLKVEVSPNSNGISTHADPELLAEAAGHVLINSAEAMAEGGAVAIGAKPSPDGWSCVWFEDRGGPVLRDVTLEMIGLPFFTLKPNRIGLGLSRARHIVHQHGGRMEIARAPNGGLRVEFFLPPASPV